MDNTYYLEGLEKYKQRDFEGAIMDFTYALEKDPENPYVFYERGMSYFHMNKKGLALMDLNKALELQPNNPYRYSSRAFMKDACGDLMGAISDYNAALELDPDDAIAHNNLGLLEEKLGRASRAKKHFDKADQLSKNKNFQSSYTLQDQVQNPVIKFNNKEAEAPKIEEEPIRKITFKDYLKVIKTLFTSKQSFQEFLTFVRRGFKI